MRGSILCKHERVDRLMLQLILHHRRGREQTLRLQTQRRRVGFLERESNGEGVVGRGNDTENQPQDSIDPRKRPA